VRIIIVVTNENFAFLKAPLDAQLALRTAYIRNIKN